MFDNEAFFARIESIVREVVHEYLAGSTKETEAPLTVKEAAKIAKVSEATIRNWLKAKHLTPLFAGRQQRVSQKELAGFMQRGLAGPTEQSPEQLAKMFLQRKG